VTETDTRGAQRDLRNNINNVGFVIPAARNAQGGSIGFDGSGPLGKFSCPAGGSLYVPIGLVIDDSGGVSTGRNFQVQCTGGTQAIDVMWFWRERTSERYERKR